MNSEHMVAGLEVNKRQDFTIKYVQGQELINTEFKHGNVVLGISEVIWGWWKRLLESRMCQKHISNGLWVLQDVTTSRNTLALFQFLCSLVLDYTQFQINFQTSGC